MEGLSEVEADLEVVKDDVESLGYLKQLRLLT